jgi:hypothetical protein
MTDKAPDVRGTPTQSADEKEQAGGPGSVSKWLNGIAVTVAVGSMMVGFATSLVNIIPNEVAGRSLVSIEERITGIESKVDNLSTEFKSISDSLNNIATLPKEAKLSFQLQQTQKTLANIQGRQDRLEQVIVTSPSKVLEIPLIKRDLENLKDAQKAEILTIKDGVDRVYDLNKWLLGAMAVSIIALAIANFLKSAGEAK